MSDPTTFPSITFPATFEGTAAIGADFSATLKLKTSNGPGVLEDLKAMPRGTYDVTIVSRQGALDGDSVDREWSSMNLRIDDEAEVMYEEHCIGGTCPHFAVATSGELEGAYVCQLAPDLEDAVKIEHGKTPCPLYPEADTAADDDASELQTEEPSVSVVIVLYPGSDEPVVTKIGAETRYGELVADYFTAAGLNDKHSAKDWTVLAEDELATTGGARKLRDIIAGADYGKRLIVAAADQGSVTGAESEGGAA